jgi:hypothetical protein
MTRNLRQHKEDIFLINAPSSVSRYHNAKYLGARPSKRSDISGGASHRRWDVLGWRVGWGGIDMEFC